MPTTDQLRTWIAAVPRTDQISFHAWALSAGVPPNVLYRFRAGQHKRISDANLAKLAAVTSVPLGGATG